MSATAVTAEYPTDHGIPVESETEYRGYPRSRLMSHRRRLFEVAASYLGPRRRCTTRRTRRRRVAACATSSWILEAAERSPFDPPNQPDTQSQKQTSADNVHQYAGDPGESYKVGEAPQFRFRVNRTQPNADAYQEAVPCQVRPSWAAAERLHGKHNSQIPRA